MDENFSKAKIVELPVLQLTPTQDTTRRNGFAAPRINPRTEIHKDSVVGETLSPANRAFIQDLQWSIDDETNMIIWSEGSLRTSAGLTTAIDAGSAGVIDSLYIYFDGTSELKTTTSLSEAMIDSKLMIVAATLTDDGVVMQVNGGAGSTVSGDAVRGGEIMAVDQSTSFDLSNSRFSIFEYLGDLLAPTVLIGKLASNVWGLLVDKGRAELRDTESRTILDSYGVVSLNQFRMASVEHSGAQTNTSTSTWTDLTNMTLSLTLTRTAVVLINVVVPCYNATSGSSAEVAIDIDSTITGPTLLAPPGSGSAINAASGTIAIQLAAGAHTIKLKFRAIVGGTATIPAYTKHLSYVVLGY